MARVDDWLSNDGVEGCTQVACTFSQLTVIYSLIFIYFSYGFYFVTYEAICRRWRVDPKSDMDLEKFTKLNIAGWCPVSYDEYQSSIIIFQEALRESRRGFPSTPSIPSNPECRRKICEIQCTKTRSTASNRSSKQVWMISR